MRQHDMVGINEERPRQITPGRFDAGDFEIVQARSIEHDDAADRVPVEEFSQSGRIVLEVAEQTQTSRMAGLGCRFARRHFKIAPDEDVSDQVGCGNGPVTVNVRSTWYSPIVGAPYRIRTGACADHYSGRSEPLS
jgi:hypothetical protein